MMEFHAPRPPNYVDQALEVVARAAHHDSFDRPKEAAYLYFLGVELLEKSLRFEQDRNTYQLISDKCHEYRQRAQYLSTLPPPVSLPSVPAHPPPSSSSSVQNPNPLSALRNALIPPDDYSKAPPSQGHPLPGMANLNLLPPPVPAPTVPVALSFADVKFERMQEAIQQLEEAKTLEQLGQLPQALKLYQSGLSQLHELYQEESSPEVKKELQQKIEQLLYRAEHVQAKIQPLGLKISAMAEPEYFRGVEFYDRAREADDILRYDDAVPLYRQAVAAFQKALALEGGDQARKYFCVRIQVCEERLEQLTHYRDKNTGQMLVRPIRMGLRPGEQYEVVEDDEENGSWWQKLFGGGGGGGAGGGSKAGGAGGKAADEGVIGVILNDAPNHYGEWLTSVEITTTRNIKDKHEQTVYTVYVMRVQSKIYEAGKLIESPEWGVVRRYSDFLDLHKRLLTLKIPLAEFPPKSWFDAMSPEVIEERKKGLEKYFHHLLTMPPNQTVNKWLLEFLRNSQMKAEAAMMKGF